MAESRKFSEAISNFIAAVAKSIRDAKAIPEGSTSQSMLDIIANGHAEVAKAKSVVVELLRDGPQYHGDHRYSLVEGDKLEVTRITVI